MKRVIIDGPTTGVDRQVITIRRLELLEPVVEGVTRTSVTADVKKCIESSEAMKTAEASPTMCKIHREKVIKSMNDFERFKYDEAFKAFQKKRRELKINFMFIFRVTFGLFIG